jgi:hypothetical protein
MLKFEVYRVVEIETVDVWVIIQHNFCRWLPMFWGNLLPPFQVRNALSVLRPLSLQNIDNHYIVLNPTKCTPNYK